MSSPPLPLMSVVGIQFSPSMQKPETTPMCRHGFDDLNLARIHSQLEGAVIIGMGSAMHGKTTFKPSPPPSGMAAFFNQRRPL
jgi:hypothetical protein